MWPTLVGLAVLPADVQAAQGKIEHFVVLLVENHAADNLFGCMDLKGFDGIRGHIVPVDPDDSGKGVVNITCGSAPYVCTQAPGYDTFAGKFPVAGSNPHTYPYSPQSDRFSGPRGARRGSTAIQTFAPEQIPVKAALARDFGVFNRLFTAVPAASSPNHLFAQSATSCGMTANVLYDDCGGEKVRFPQRTIFDALREADVPFGFFLNSTCGLDGQPCHGEDPHDPDSASAVSTPDVAMEGVGRYKERFFSQELFYQQAAAGALPRLSWLHPPMQACDHPCHDVAKGERLLKDVYEALRAGPGWPRTLLFVAYDDAGGYYDHVVPPSEGVPADGAACHRPGLHPRCGPAFDFRRLGLRTSAMLISPWVKKGSVFQRPAGPTPTSQFELTSIPATAKNLFNLPTFLTNRDAWAGSFHELLTEPKPRADAPMHLPDAPLPATPWDPPPPEPSSGLGGQAVRVGSAGDVAASPRHCSSVHGGDKESECREPSAVNLKQERTIRLLAALTRTLEPRVEQMSRAQADGWIARTWRQYMKANPAERAGASEGGMTVGLS
jgi:phospholipase C